MSDPGSSSEKHDIKALLIKGAIGAVALIGTTAIPIVVQQSLRNFSAPAASPTGAAQVSPAAEASPNQMSLPVDSSQMRSDDAKHQANGQDENDDKPGRKGKKKHKGED